MMSYMPGETRDIAHMPRGGFNASCLDRRLQTDRLEYLDRDDVDHLKRQVVRSLEVVGSLFGDHQRFARLALAEVDEVPDPTILELAPATARCRARC
ncbi:hypothetical protein C1Y40_00305 [Mycobacterium talmoniae]|uniref:Uncharacterized protein n=1 Tax=Mycobacterium talmoniae TaxID=1858794 RepID=A0A2S8BS50_9MYCO|nr:hypothetical protein C1Y40_00305 [Mycobacterium talmoniae]